MYIDPALIQWFLLGGIAVCSFMVGRNWNALTQDQIIENTILWMIENNMVRAKKVNGEWEIENLDGED